MLCFFKKDQIALAWKRIYWFESDRHVWMNLKSFDCIGKINTWDYKLLFNYYVRWDQALKLRMRFSSHVFFVIVLCLSSWLSNLNKILILDFQKLWVTFVPNKCPHPKQVAPCQDLEKCAEVGVGVGGMGCHTLLNSPSSLRGGSLMDYEYWHHSCFPMAIGKMPFELNNSLHNYFSQATWSRPESDNLQQPEVSDKVQMFGFMVFRGPALWSWMRHNDYLDEWEDSSEITAFTELDHWG